MKPWKLGDGTLIHLGGKVDGDSYFADQVRSVVTDVQQGNPPSSGFGATPHELPLDFSQAHLVDAWLTNYYGDFVVSHPDFKTPVLPPRPALPDGDRY